MKYTSVLIGYMKEKDARKFCRETFGPGKEPKDKWSEMIWFGTASGKFPYRRYRFFFKDPQHATFFKLKFGNDN